jgi:2-oxoglutarate ferredoxin oxidoreductase subunit delta
MARQFRVTIERNRCKGCELCGRACPKGVLGMSKDLNEKGYFFAQVQAREKCTGCRFCAMTCPDVAISIEQLEGTE